MMLLPRSQKGAHQDGRNRVCSKRGARGLNISSAIYNNLISRDSFTDNFTFWTYGRQPTMSAMMLPSEFQEGKDHGSRATKKNIFDTGGGCE